MTVQKRSLVLNQSPHLPLYYKWHQTAFTINHRRNEALWILLMKSNYGTSKFQRKKFWTHINSQSYAIKRYSLCNNLETWLVDRLFGRNKLWKMQNYWSSSYFCFTFNLRRTEIPKYIISIKHDTIYMVVETVCMQSSLDIGLTRHIFSANCFNHKAIKIKFHFGLAWIKS